MGTRFGRLCTFRTPLRPARSASISARQSNLESKAIPYRYRLRGKHATEPQTPLRTSGALRATPIGHPKEWVKTGKRGLVGANRVLLRVTRAAGGKLSSN